MPFRIPSWRQVYGTLGFSGTAFAATAGLGGLFSWIGSGASGLFLFFAFLFGAWVTIRLLRALARRAIWRLRNRLLVTYLFIALVPILLILTLVGLGAWALTSQTAVHMVKTELDRRVRALRTLSRSVEQAETAERPEVMQRVGALFADRYPGLRILLREGGKPYYFPPGTTVKGPPPGWGPMNGIVIKDGEYFAVSYATTPSGDLTVLAPLTSDYLAELVPGLGMVFFQEFQEAGERPAPRGRGRVTIRPPGAEEPLASVPGPAAADTLKDRLPPRHNVLDIDVPWVAKIDVLRWEAPAVDKSQFFLVVRTRPSAVLTNLFSSQVDWTQGILPVLLGIVAVIFLIVELVALVIGISMTRTITRAVHHLYEGTQKIMEGDFSHRIRVRGRDQLAELGHSFNRMTENLERLLVVAKEKERLQSEIEIAREVQGQLYPKSVPSTPTLQLTAVCHPARMVSGDYYDYEAIGHQRIAIAIGDVAGKGISAALLMAALQSSLRAQLQNAAELAAALPDDGLSPARLVAKLNLQLYANTSPEKYATFCLGLYDEATSTLRYSNAGHLPPILVRGGEASRLEVNGTVVGAFPFARYEESRIVMQPGDLLVWFTDGVSEPENEYGEMFGEERLVKLLTRNAHRADSEIIEAVISAVEEWTGSGELQDDLTLMLARKC
jgi:sigma-B regulation protein RsbU (phosphoserine phosphatase)